MTSPRRPAARPPVVASLEAAARLLALPLAELWEGVESPGCLWHAPGGAASGADATLVATLAR